MRRINPVVIGMCGCMMFAGIAGAHGAAAERDARQAYNRGVALYDQGEYNKAAEAFQQALDTPHSRTEAWTNYNLGNARFEQAQAAGAGQPAAGVGQLKEALLFFRRALDIDPQDKDAKYNYELTRERLKELEQQARQQSEGNSQPQPEKDAPAPADTSDEQAPQEEESPPPRPEEASPPEAREDEDSAGRSADDPQRDMTPQEAQMLLDNFQRQEQSRPQAMHPERPRQEAAVEKDW